VNAPSHPGPKPAGDPVALRAAADRARAQAKALRDCAKDVSRIVKGNWFEGPGRAGIDGEVRGAATSLSAADSDLEAAAAALDQKAEEIGRAQASWLIADMAYRAWQALEQLL